MMIVMLLLLLASTPHAYGVSHQRQPYCIETERQALLTFKQALVDPDDALQSWTSNNKDCCTWKGIRCDNLTNHIIMLHLDPNITYHDNGGFSWHPFSGEISASLVQLQYLEYLDLSYNHFTKIPKFIGAFTNLQYLDFSHNSITGNIPSELGNLTKLRILDLSHSISFKWHLNLGKIIEFNNNSLIQVPKSIGGLCRLQVLALSNNEFNSTIIDILENLLNCNNNSLQILDLSHNRLIGPLPRDLSRFSYLRELDVSYNKFNDTLPESIGKLSSLELLDISNNSFIGFVSETHLEKLSKLKQLDLSSNSLTLKTNITWVPPFQLQYINLRSCMIGPQFPSWLQTQSNISQIDLSSSGISDVIPEWFFNMTSNLEDLNLSSNLINSTLPDILLESAINFASVDLSSNQFHGHVPLNSLFKVNELNLSNNTLIEFDPLFCTSFNGTVQFLDLSNNQIFGSLPDCWFRLQNLEVLYLNNNRLSGVIPNSIASLYKIHTLILRNNNLSGTLPSSIKNCTQLVFLDVGENNLEGTIPMWIGETLTGLVILHLKSNHFHGTIPLSLCHLQQIRILDISRNNIYGAIPSCINNFTSMVEIIKEDDFFEKHVQIDIPWHSDSSSSYVTSYDMKALVTWKGKEYEYQEILGLLRVIDFSSNRLTGEIPRELTNLLGLVQLNLFWNNLSGAIPQKIENLSKLESLDLSHNNFTGKIPIGLGELSFLEYLNLSYNHLSGRIPTGTQLQSFNAYSYVENDGLCGAPLSECPGDHIAFKDNPHSDLDQERFDMSWFYIGLEVGFAFGFIGVCGALYRNYSFLLETCLSSRCLNTFGDWLYVMISIRISKLKRCLQS